MIKTVIKDQVFLRPLEFEDAPSIANYANNRGIWKMLGDKFPHPYRIEDARDFIEGVKKNKELTVFGIVNSNEVIGVISFIPGEDTCRFNAEIGYWVGEDWWGKGIMTEVVKVFSGFLFNEKDFNRLFARVMYPNNGSSKVLEKNGFKREAILKKNCFKDGEFVDEILYAKIKA